MTFVSYAQNFEDLLLWRALSNVGAGFYIDVGASHPDTDSVTRAFYDRGWSGINVEPEPEAFRRLSAARPRDINLQMALGERRSEATLHVVADTGLSTLESAIAAGHAQAGMRLQPITVLVDTLASICRNHVRRDIHFLKIDVEGAEQAVLEGADFQSCRPWIVLVEATAPTTTAQNHAAWEGLLLDAGYGFVWFDGLNRYYVAAERHDALAPAFRLPPNVFDDFVRVADTDWARRIHRAETEAASQCDRAARAEAELERLLPVATHATAAAAGLAGALERLQQRLDRTLAQWMDDARRAQAEIDLANHRIAQASSGLAAVHASNSWRMTAPLRQIAISLRRWLPSPLPSDLEAWPAVDRGRPLPPPETTLPAVALRPRTRVVHQFHSGSAVGDAITNAMLMTRGLLRGLGFASEIYVEHRDPLLADELRLVQELPEHDGYVLLLHHSMGYDAYAQIVALPAPKILMYHNITPTYLLADNPAFQNYSVVGRRQLADLRGRVAAALADSDYNAIELHSLGFDAPRTCTLLFDLEQLQARVQARPHTRRSAAFTVLFVGRVSEAKGQDVLIEAFAAFRAGFATGGHGSKCRLVLVGRHGGEAEAFLRRMHAAIAAHGMQDEVLFTGLVTDAELDAWYDAADLFVSASRHEGFGVPLVEAIAHGVPVLACAGGAIEYTLGDAPGMLAERDPAAIADAMLAVARDPASHVRRQSAALQRFALPRQTSALLTALAAAGAMPPEPASLRAPLTAGLRFTVTGHVNASYSLAIVNRTLAVELEAQRPGRVRLVPVEGEPIADTARVPPWHRARIARVVARPPHDGGPEMVISQHYPVYVPENRGDVLCALFFWEESLIPVDTVAVLNRSFRALLAPSRFVAGVLVNSGVRVPVRPISYVPDLQRFAAIARPRQPARPFTFLHVSSCFPRKGVDLLLAAFARAFRATDAVRLVIKGFPNPHNTAAEQIAAARASDPGLPEIVLIDREIDDDTLLGLYAEAGVMVLPTRGEGFNIPAAEALAAGLPLIVTGYGGHMDFCSPANARLLAWRHAVSGTHLATPHSLWVEPDLDDLVAALREAVDQPQLAESRVAAGREAAHRLAAAPVAQQLEAIGVDMLLAPPPRPARIAWISTWNVRCGIAEYSRYILDNLPAQDGLPAPVVLSDERTLHDPYLDHGRAVRPVWHLAGDSRLDALEQAIGRADPDVVVLQHQPGLFGWRRLAQLLRLPALQARAVSVTLHNTRHLMDVTADERETALAALAGVARVVVHTLADLDLLQALGLVDNATMLPHGAPAAPEPRPVRTLGSRDAPIIGCYGFFLPGKGIPELIAALGLLRARWPQARLRLVNAEYDGGESAAHIAACRAAAAPLGAAVEWHTAFLPQKRSLELLAGCDIVALPYQASKEASSAALRTALAGGAPAMVSPIPLFDEAGDAVIRFAGTDPAAIAAGLDRLLADRDGRAALQARAQAWLAARAWPRIAERFHLMLHALSENRMARPETGRLAEAREPACDTSLSTTG